MGLAHAGQSQQHTAQEIAIGLHVRDPGLDEVIEPTRHHVAFHDLRAVFHRGLEGLEDIGRGAIEHHFDKDHHAAAQQLRIEPGVIAEDVPVARQALHTLVDGGGRQMHGFGQFQRGQTPVRLQQAQDAAVDLVEFFVFWRHCDELVAMNW